MTRALLAVVLIGTLAFAGSTATAANTNVYTVHNLVSDGAVTADRTDPNLVNGWGLTSGPMTPWWVADNGTDRSTLYRGDGTIVPLVVSVDGGPTGAVFNNTPDFVVTDGTSSGAARFIFASEDGKIRGWNPIVPASSTVAQVGADRSGVGAIYKGLTLASTAAGNFLYAADFHNARVDMFDGTFQVVTPAGAFVDPGIPAGYAPFGIQNLGGRIFVTYAKQDAAAEDEIAGQGRGFVSVFSTSGDFLERVATHGQLNAPWGLAFAPAGFGKFSGDLLVGNFGNGRINAYEPQPDGTFELVGPLRGHNHRPLAIDGLWGIGFGNGNAAGPTTTLFFAAGPDDEEHGLFGKIEAG
jgi:uncharacterized protein (TIGR03118 family)